MTRTVAREIAIQLSFAAQLAGDDARETADTFFSREYFATLAEEGPAVSGISGREAARLYPPADPVWSMTICTSSTT